MSDNRPEPFIGIDIDVRDLDGFMLNVERLLASELLAIGTPEECWAALMLWCRAWKQLPAGSLPNDCRILASFSRAGKRWGKVREVALHGFVECSDGRLYHRVLCAEAQRAFEKKKAFINRREVDRKRLSEWRASRRTNGTEPPPETPFDPDSRERDTGYETPDETGVKRVSSRKGQGQGQGVSKEGSPGSREESLPPESDSSNAAAPPHVLYAFAGRVVRLSAKDYNTWAKAFYAIHDFNAELTALDDYYSDLPSEENKGWFHRCSSALAKKHQAIIAEKKKPNGGILPNEGVF